MDAIAEHPRHGAAAKVGLILTSRLTNDLRVCSLSAQLGYGIQALVVGATIVEVAGALAYVGDSVSRAARWVNIPTSGTPTLERSKKGSKRC